MKRSISIPAGLVLIVAGCATSVPVPRMEQPGASGIAISVRITKPFGFPTVDADEVYFVKLDDSGSIQQRTLIPSNYRKGARTYLLNAAPGEYVAVAVKLKDPQHPVYTTFFSKEVVELTRVKIGSGQLVCAGNYVLSTSATGERDPVQHHYETVMYGSSSTLTTGMSAIGWGNPRWRGTLQEAKSDDNTKGECIRRAKEDLRRSRWRSRGQSC